MGGGLALLPAGLGVAAGAGVALAAGGGLLIGVGVLTGGGAGTLPDSLTEARGRAAASGRSTRTAPASIPPRGRGGSPGCGWIQDGFGDAAVVHHGLAGP